MCVVGICSGHDLGLCDPIGAVVLFCLCDLLKEEIGQLLAFLVGGHRSNSWFHSTLGRAEDYSSYLHCSVSVSVS